MTARTVNKSNPACSASVVLVVIKQKIWSFVSAKKHQRVVARGLRNDEIIMHSISSFSQ